eukprot:jgi/Astpho2/3725/fgenesh1_pm.00060_%23_13_t
MPVLQRDEKTAADYYTDSYAHHGIHEEMLKDTVRTRSYQAAINHSAHHIRGKTVLDIGCGTGILSLFAAKVGAAHVYGIDASSIADQAQQIVKENGFEDKITIIKGKVEEVELPVQKVDVIISEWMGYFLFYESMLDTVLMARDKWLVPGGVMLPDKCTLSLEGIEDGEYRQEKIEWWNSVYGFKMNCIKELAMAEPLVDTVNSEQIGTDSQVVKSIDIATMSKEDATFKVPFKLRAQRDDYIHALVAHFDVFFTRCHKPVKFSTAPWCKNTHWKQTVFYLEDTLVVCEGETIEGTLTCAPNARNNRDLDIEIQYSFEGRQHRQVAHTQQFKMR